MFIVWGRKIVRRKLGYVADFCPICRKPATFELQRVGSAGHIYYISAGQGALVGFEKQCTKCHTSLNAEPTHYTSVADKKLAFPALVAQTFPKLHEALKARLDLEEQIRLAPATISPEDRHALIRHPFLLLSPKVEQRYAATHLDLEIVLAFVGAIFLMIIGVAVAKKVALDYEGPALLVFIVIGIVMVGWQLALSGRRYMRKHIIPVLAGSLKPLKPTSRELQTTIDELKRLGHKMGSKLKATDLSRHLSQPAP